MFRERERKRERDYICPPPLVFKIIKTRNHRHSTPPSDHSRFLTLRLLARGWVARRSCQRVKVLNLYSTGRCSDAPTLNSSSSSTLTAAQLVGGVGGHGGGTDLCCAHFSVLEASRSLWSSRQAVNFNNYKSKRFALRLKLRWQGIIVGFEFGQAARPSRGARGGS